MIMMMMMMMIETVRIAIAIEISEVLSYDNNDIVMVAIIEVKMIYKIMY